MAKCGIYKFTNKINNKIYIGQSVDIDRRIREHYKIPDDTPFHMALKKYGKENFVVEILEECDTTELNEKEVYYISLYDSENRDIGYNRTSGGNGRAKKAVIQYDSNGNLIKKYDSIKLASSETLIPSPNIQSCCSLKRKSAGGFLWRYEDDNPPKPYVFNQKEHLKQLSLTNKTRGCSGGRPSKIKEIQKWRKLNPKGIKSQCIKETGISRTTVYKYWNSVEEL